MFKSAITRESDDPTVTISADSGHRPGCAGVCRDLRLGARVGVHATPLEWGGMKSHEARGALAPPAARRSVVALDEREY